MRTPRRQVNLRLPLPVAAALTTAAEAAMVSANAYATQVLARHLGFTAATFRPPPAAIPSDGTAPEASSF